MLALGALILLLAFVRALAGLRRRARLRPAQELYERRLRAGSAAGPFMR